MLSLMMNDAAAETLGFPAGRPTLAPPDGLAPRLRVRLSEGITRRGEVLSWTRSTGYANSAPSVARDLTDWECADSSFHLEDYVPVDARTVDDVPQISEHDQRILLLHGIAFAMEFRQLVNGLDAPEPVRCIIGANESSATFRFHQIRRGESWHDTDLDRYQTEKIVVIDLKPADN
ncbi:hypothetical protein [Streptomyces sp. NPDC051921]|uniref:hypothetical protein n=1 Tax=Streptomyces sp. NPDC051921 TaxID=3155806 RepID=UPI0034482CF6